ncbi:MAG: hypothetical protein NC821_06535 [Candidatus Omnitrophica bacterium]|nr:hypothetical protein [Candidatus Omnitrophota bacterium]
MLTNYIHSAMRRAKYEILPDDGTFDGIELTVKEVIRCPVSVRSNGKT